MVLTVCSNKLDEKKSRVKYKRNFQTKSHNIIKITLQMFAGNGRDFAGKSECRDFKFRGIACIPAIPLILKFPHSNFHYNICSEFDCTGILWGFPALNVGKPCNNLIFGDILQGSPVNFKLMTCVHIFPLQYLHAYLK